MSSKHQADRRLSADMTVGLLRRAQQERTRGNAQGARAILRALAEHKPQDLRVWMLLATVAEDRIEQARVFEHILTLAPDHQIAQRGLERLRAAGLPSRLPEAPPAQPNVADFLADTRWMQPLEEPPDAPPAMAPVALSADPPAEPPARRRWGPLLVVTLGLAAAAVLLLVRPWEQPPQAALQPTPAPPTPAGTPTPTLEPVTLEPVGTPTPARAQATPSPAPTAKPSQPASSPTPDTTATPTAPAGLASGQIVRAGIWTVTVLDSEHVRELAGSIGPTLQPSGRFVLALVTVSNGGSRPARLPRDLLALFDQSGQRYLAQPGASTVYLETYGRGRFGDFSAEDLLPPSGNLSVPLIFDVPQRSRSLTLRVGAAPAGWAVAPPASAGQ